MPRTANAINYGLAKLAVNVQKRPKHSFAKMTALPQSLPKILAIFGFLTKAWLTDEHVILKNVEMVAIRTRTLSYPNDQET
jgi:hypothetical protein